ncbi:MAG TPA: hypothetical protein VKK79_02540, partial [Candidatus Lokiarchaeia archaeon]|nr:hypothetical protein [Candidatus Lokiarchaeia archaeon]
DFSFTKGATSPDVYGVSDTVVTLWTLGLLDEYLQDSAREEWISTLQSFQNPTTGWYTDRARRTLHFKPHTTAFAIAALNLLDGRPLYPLKFAEKLRTQKKLEHWLSRWWMWAPRIEWIGSHVGSGVAASIFMTDTTMPAEWWDWFFGWLNTHVDPNTGFWKHGLLHGTKQFNFYDLGAAFHYYFFYVRQGRLLPYPEKIVDASLVLQQPNHLWFHDVPYCPDLDAIYAMVRASEQVGGYRRADIEMAVRNYLDFVVPKINDRAYVFKTYPHTHTMTGLVATLAEVQRFLPEVLRSPKPLSQILDVALYI